MIFYPLFKTLLDSRLLQLRMEKEEMEEELGEKVEILQRDLEQARASTRDTQQVEELKKVLGTWGVEWQVGPICLT